MKHGLLLAVCLLAACCMCQELSADASVCYAVPAFDTWLAGAGTVMDDRIAFDSKAFVRATEDINIRTVVQTVPVSLLFGWKEGEGVKSNLDDTLLAGLRMDLTASLLTELKEPTEQWKPFMDLLKAQIPYWETDDEEEGGDYFHAVGACNDEWATPALLWSDKQLAHPNALESTLVPRVYAARKWLQESFPDDKLGDIAWAYSVALGRSMSVYDGSGMQLVLMPIGSNLATEPHARTSFAVDNAAETARFWIDLKVEEGAKMGANYASLSTHDLVMYYGYHLTDNQFERVPFEVFLDVNDRLYTEKDEHASNLGLFETPPYPLGKNFYLNLSGAPSNAMLALLRLRVYDPKYHAPAKDDREKQRKKRELEMANSWRRDAEEEAKYPNPMRSIGRENEMAVLKDLAEQINQILANVFSNDETSDQRIYGKPAALGEERDMNAINAVAVRIVEKAILGKGHRRASSFLSEIVKAKAHDFKQKKSEPRPPRVDPAELQRELRNIH